MTLGQIGAAGVVDDQVGEQSPVPVVADASQHFLGLGRLVAAAHDPGALAVGGVGLKVIPVTVAGPVEAALQLEAHLQIGEPVAVFHHLGVDAVILLLAEDVTLVALHRHGADELGIAEFLGGVLGQAADVVKGYAGVGREAFEERSKILAEHHVGQHLGLGVLLLSKLLHLGHRVDGAIQGGSAIGPVGLLHGESGRRQGIQGLFDAAAVIAFVEFSQACHDAHLHGGGFGDIHIDVGPDTQAVVVMIGVVAVVGRLLLVEEILLEIVDGGEVTEVLVTALESELGLVVVTVVAEHLVPPIHIGIGVRVLAAVEGEQLRVIVFDGQAVQDTCFVHEETIGIGVGELRSPEHGLVSVLIVGRHLQGHLSRRTGRRRPHPSGR